MKCELPIDCMREAYLATLTDVGTILTYTRTPDSDFGGGDVSYTASGTVVCSIRASRTPREVIVADRMVSIIPFEIDLPYGSTVNVKEDDRDHAVCHDNPSYRAGASFEEVWKSKEHQEVVERIIDGAELDCCPRCVWNKRNEVIQHVFREDQMRIRMV